jgi:methylated-DNA-[protein]-cysteine S-methyltransferase
VTDQTAAASINVEAAGSRPARREYRLLGTPTGPFAVIREPDRTFRTAWVIDRSDPILRNGVANVQLEPDLVRRLEAYFAGEPAIFHDVATPEGPEFFRRCWEICRTIPRGKTCSYGELARLAGGSAGAARAAGQAMRRNPMPIIVPCHRVIGRTGGLVGFAGSSDPRGAPIDRKRWLLALEQTGRDPD